MSILIKNKFASWEHDCNKRFNTLKANEEEQNHIFIDIYGLQDELTPEIENNEIYTKNNGYLHRFFKERSE